MKDRLRDLLSSRPILDHSLPLIVLFAWWFFLSGWTPNDASTRQWVYATMATVSGLVLAASTFACTMTYQATDTLMVKVRQRNSAVLRRNWFAILQSSLATAALPLLCFAIDGELRQLSGAIVIYMTTLLLLRFRRALAMLALVLFVAENSSKLAKATPAKLVIPKSAK